MINLSNVKRELLNKFKKVGIGINVQDANTCLIVTISLNIGSLIVMRNYVINEDGSVKFENIYSNYIYDETEIISKIYDNVRNIELSLSKYNK